MFISPIRFSTCNKLHVKKSTISSRENNSSNSSNNRSPVYAPSLEYFCGGNSYRNKVNNLDTVDAPTALTFCGDISNRSARDKAYVSALANGIGCDPVKLQSVVGPDELNEILSSMKPEDYDPTKPEFKINLHLHTTASDGKFTPKTLFEATKIQAEQNNGKFIVAITDHDSMGGIKSALEYIAENYKDLKNIRFVPGVEINTTYHNESLFEDVQMEMLCFCINPFIENGLSSFLKQTKMKNKKLVNKIIKKAIMDYGIDISDFKEFKQSHLDLKNATGTDIMLGLHQYLSEKDINDAQIESLFSGKIPVEYTTINTPFVSKILEFAKNEDAIAGIAHPIRINLDKIGNYDTALSTILSDFKQCGGQFADANYQWNKATNWMDKDELTRRKASIHNICDELLLLKSGGIDNHGLSLSTRK